MKRFAAFVSLLLATTGAGANETTSCKAGEIEVVLAAATASIVFQEQLNEMPGLTGKAKLPAEGSLLPGIYCVAENAKRAKVVTQMSDAMTQFLAQEWLTRDAAAFVQTPKEAINLASIVESSQPAVGEWNKIAAVYTNRLRLGMMLQVDSTIIYPITKGRPLGRHILFSEMTDRNGYNTYQRTGLPKGPITNPSKEAIRAALNPAKSDVLFFVSNGEGGHVFASTLEEHDANVENWYRIRRERGEM